MLSIREAGFWASVRKSRRLEQGMGRKGIGQTEDGTKGDGTKGDRTNR